jgi:hypothetical protein
MVKTLPSVTIKAEDSFKRVGKLEILAESGAVVAE